MRKYPNSFDLCLFCFFFYSFSRNKRPRYKRNQEIKQTRIKKPFANKLETKDFRVENFKSCKQRSQVFRKETVKENLASTFEISKQLKMKTT
jgi:hypothetical protein